jgi:hypothetical protein
MGISKSVCRYLLYNLANPSIFAVLDSEHYSSNATKEDLRVSHALLDLPFLAEIVEEMMLPRYHLEEDGESWSPDALAFLSCSLSGSIESLLKVKSALMSRTTS